MVRKTNGRYRLPRIAGNTFRCPRCGSRIYWKVIGGRAGAKGYAHCSKSIYASQIFERSWEGLDFCIWEGDAVRLSNGNVEIWDDLSWTDLPHTQLRIIICVGTLFREWHKYVIGDLVYFIGYEYLRDTNECGIVINIRDDLDISEELYEVYWIRRGYIALYSSSQLNLVYEIDKNTKNIIINVR